MGYLVNSWDISDYYFAYVAISSLGLKKDSFYVNLKIGKFFGIGSKTKKEILVVLEKITIVYELSDEMSFFEERREIVWLSRHPLTLEQKKSLLYLHNHKVRVVQNNINFSGPRNMISWVEHFSKQGAMVYLVSPSWYEGELKRNCSQYPNFIFRKFSGWINPDENFSFTGVIECENKDGFFHSRPLLSKDELSYLDSRQDNIDLPSLPPLQTIANPV